MLKSICICAFLLSALFVFSTAPGQAQTAAPSSAPSAVPQQADPKVTAMAKDWLHRAQTGNVDRSQLTDEMSAALTPSLVQQVATQMAPLGEPTSMSFVGSSVVQGVTLYHFVFVFPAAKVAEFLGIDAAGKIAGLRFTPAQ